jgi:ribosomal protein S4
VKKKQTKPRPKKTGRPKPTAGAGRGKPKVSSRAKRVAHGFVAASGAPSGAVNEQEENPYAIDRSATANGVRLNRWLAEQGVDSRRKCDQKVLDGEVSVNGTVIMEPGYRVQHEDEVSVNGARIHRARRLYYLFYKPRGVLCTNDPRETRTRLCDLVDPMVPSRVYPIGQFHGTPIAKGLSQLFDKLEGVLVEPIDLDPALIADKVSFHGGHPRAISSQVWRTLVGSLRNHQVLRLYYQAAGHPKPTVREVEPVHLACRMGDWYLLARRTGASETRTYALSRIKNAEALRKYFSPQRTDSNQSARKTFARFVAHGGKSINVKVRFTPESSEWIREREWHAEQKISEHRDGGLTITLPIDGDKEALSWVLRWGAQAKVVGPKWLKERVREEAKAMI